MTELIVAVDAEPCLETRAMISALAAADVRWFKVGVPMLLGGYEGQKTIDFVRVCEAELMLDLKLYDTRDTVLRAIEAAVQMGAGMVTVHADSAIHTVDERRTKILAVRPLTDGTAAHRAGPAVATVDGIVCSVAHAKFMRRKTDKLLVCPGIRPSGAERHNHESPATPAAARDAGADFIVVGRPIYQATDPVAAALAIKKELEGR